MLTLIDTLLIFCTHDLQYFIENVLISIDYKRYSHEALSDGD